MDAHKNARLTPHSRALLVRGVLVEGLRPEEITQARGVGVRTVYKWLQCYRQEGPNPPASLEPARPYTPRTNGKAKRCIQAALRE